jgi:hypothetical protein
MKQLEDRVARAAAAVWTVSADDTAYFASLDGTLARTFALPSPVVPVKDGRVAKQRAVGMIGSWTWDLSREALRWFVERVLPLLPPELDVEVAGRGADWLSSHAPRVRYIGFAPDAGRFMASSRVVAIPAIGTTGVQVKTLDAIASGSRIVASPPAVRELDSPPASVRVAGSAEEFAHAVAELATSSGSLEPDLDAIEWTRARRVRFESDVAEAVASVAVAR